MKQRMTTADVSAEVACLREAVCGMRVANIYDIDARVRPAAFRRYVHFAQLSVNYEGCSVTGISN